jgi:pimeloyl-ACP methyl ester carboxylesterase
LSFTPLHRGGSGPPLVCLHGFADTWRTWELVLPALERQHDVLAPTLAGHAGGPPIEGEIGAGALADAVERAMDEAGFASAHLVGNSLGGYVALQLAARGRAQTVVALAPAGGWARGDESYKELFDFQLSLHELARTAAPHAEAIVSSPEGRRRATQYITTNFEHIPAELVAHQMLGVASCEAAPALIDHATREGWSLQAEKITCCSARRAARDRTAHPRLHLDLEEAFEALERGAAHHDLEHDPGDPDDERGHDDSEVLEQHRQRQQHDAERGQRVQPRERRGEEGAEAAADHE